MEGLTMSTVAQRLAAFTSKLQASDLPPEVAEAARLHLLDTIGCGLAGYALGVASGARDAVLEEGTSGPATAIGVPGGLPAIDAAMYNGVTCHALDFDDTQTAAVAHVSVAVVPAALAAAQFDGVSGAELLAAIAAGNEVVLRLAAGPLFHNVGFHPTAILGVFGATAAAARIRGLDAETTTQAFGIAGSLASGVLEHLADGSSTKRLHPGFAARSGILAARLAAHGETGPSTIIEGRFGIYNAYLRRPDLPTADQLDGLGETWLTPTIAYKPYPACHFLHAAVDATVQATAGQTIDPTQITEIVAYAPEDVVPIVLEPLADKHDPRSEYDAKFSLPYSVASMLVRGKVDVMTYVGDAIREEKVLDVARRVRYETKDFPTFGKAFPGGVKISLQDGTVLEGELQHQRGGVENPLTADDVIAKYRSNAEIALGADDVAAVERAILALQDEADLSAFEVLGRAAIREGAAA
jgi:2-methylcitrate dehydratase PrpD